MSIIAVTPHEGPTPQQSDRQNPAEEPAGTGHPVWSGQETATAGIPEKIEDLASQIVSVLGLLVEKWRATRTPDNFVTTLNRGFSAPAENSGPLPPIPDIAGPPANDVVSVTPPTRSPARTPTQTDEISKDPAMPTATLDTQISFPEVVSQLSMAARPGTSSVLHVGCGENDQAKLPPTFRRDGWREIRLDIDSGVRPDFVASITDMNVIAGGTMDAVYSSHNIEHLYPHEVPLALREMHRVLNPAGFALIKVPDLQEVARHVAEGNLEDPLYVSTMGPISALDILYGHRASLVSGNVFMAHRTGFTGATLGSALVSAGFAAVMVQRNPAAFSLAAVAFKIRPDEQRLAGAQALILPDPDLPAVLYARAG